MGNRRGCLLNGHYCCWQIGMVNTKTQQELLRNAVCCVVQTLCQQSKKPLHQTKRGDYGRSQRQASWDFGQISGISLLSHTQDKLVPLTDFHLGSSSAFSRKSTVSLYLFYGNNPTNLFNIGRLTRTDE